MGLELSPFDLLIAVGTASHLIAAVLILMCFDILLYQGNIAILARGHLMEASILRGFLALNEEMTASDRTFNFRKSAIPIEVVLD